MKQLYILPFDHRGSFMKMMNAASPPTDEDVAKARDSKEVIYEAFKKAVEGGVPKDNAGVLVDEWLGLNVLKEAQSDGFITCTPFEKSGQDEFDFEYENWQEKIDELNPTYVKVLVRYNPESDKEMNQRQAQRLAQLSKFLEGKPNEFLFELLVPPTEEQLKEGKDNFESVLRPKLMVQAIKEMQDAGVEPQVWKIEGLDSTEAMEQVAQQATKDGRDAGIIILGRGESAEKAEHWLRMGAKVEAAVGFAVGRTIFKEPIENYAKGELSREDAVDQIAKNYSFFVDVWQQAR